VVLGSVVADPISLEGPVARMLRVRLAGNPADRSRDARVRPATLAGLIERRERVDGEGTQLQRPIRASAKPPKAAPTAASAAGGPAGGQGATPPQQNADSVAPASGR